MQIRCEIWCNLIQFCVHGVKNYSDLAITWIALNPHKNPPAGTKFLSVTNTEQTNKQKRHTFLFFSSLRDKEGCGLNLRSTENAFTEKKSLNIINYFMSQIIKDFYKQ